jgi:hypothetical protein
MQFSHFDLNLLRSLDALLAERNVTRASERLFVTQQAMSGALRRLREHFENELLVRVGRQMELTPLARSLALPVREALLKAETALNTQPSFDPVTAKGTVRVAMSDYTSLVLPTWERRHRHVTQARERLVYLCERARRVALTKPADRLRDKPGDWRDEKRGGARTELKHNAPVDNAVRRVHKRAVELPLARTAPKARG